MESELAAMQAKLRREARKERGLNWDHLASLPAARLAAAAKRRSGRCAICRDGIDPELTSLCTWCHSVAQAQKKAKMRRVELAFARQGYQILGPQGGRRWTRNGDPGCPS